LLKNSSVVLTDKCPFYISMKSKLGNCGIKVWVAADAKIFHANKMHLHIGRTDGARDKRQGLRVLKDMVCYIYGNGRGVTADNFFTSCELANRLLTWIMTWVGTLKEKRA
jgi:hypothetical protein